MKKFLAFLMTLLLILSLTACGVEKTEDVSLDGASKPSVSAAVIIPTEKFPENTVIKTTVVEDVAPVKAIIKTAKSLEFYDINALVYNEKVQPSGEVEVTFPLPKNYDADKHTIEVYFVSDDGKAEKVQSSVANGAVVAKLKHFSVYAVAVVEKPTFNLAVDADAKGKDGQKYFFSDINLTFAFDENDTFITFAQKNKDKGFSVDKDFFGKEDIVYFTYDGTRYQLNTAYSRVVKPESAVKAALEYACLLPQRASIQTEWMYDVSNEKYTPSDNSDTFDRTAKVLNLDTNEKTYTIKFLMFKSIDSSRYTWDSKILETGTYTSDDGNTLGATLTLSGGYVLKTTRADSFKAELTKDGKTITVNGNYMHIFMDPSR